MIQNYINLGIHETYYFTNIFWERSSLSWALMFNIYFSLLDIFRPSYIPRAMACPWFTSIISPVNLCISSLIIIMELFIYKSLVDVNFQQTNEPFEMIRIMIALAISANCNICICRYSSYNILLELN